MGRGNAALQRKVEELESEIGRLLEHPPSYIHDDVDGKVSFYQTARKIDFIKNLLTAEMDSHSRDRPEHLNRMATRLSILEKAFVDWAIPTRFSILDDTFANRVEPGDNNGAVNNKCPDTSASCSCTESCVVDEEFEEESNINQEAKESDALETETVLSHVSQAGVQGNKEEVLEDEKEYGRNQGEEKEGGSKVEVTKDEKEGGEKKETEMVTQREVEVNANENVGAKKQEAETAEERKEVAKEDGQERDSDRKEKRVAEVKEGTTEEKGRRKQGGDTVGERMSEAKTVKGSKRKEGPELVGESRAKETEEEMAGEKTTETKEENEKERNQERIMVGESKVEVIDNKKRGREKKKGGEMTKVAMTGRGRNREAAMVQKAEVNEDDEGRERKQRCRVKNCIAMGCAAMAGFIIALIGVSLANLSCVEETVYLVPT